MNSRQIPTSFRFKKKKDAKNWGRTTKDWNTISEIHHIGNGLFNMASDCFAWVSFNLKTVDDELEFKYNEKLKLEIEDEYVDEEE